MLQILGIRPYAAYKTMTSEEMVEKFMSTIKAPFNVKDKYWRNLVVLVQILILWKCLILYTLSIYREGFAEKMRVQKTTPIISFECGYMLRMRGGNHQMYRWLIWWLQTLQLLLQRIHLPCNPLPLQCFLLSLKISYRLTTHTKTMYNTSTINIQLLHTILM